MLTFLGGGRGCAGALTRPSTRHLLPKNFEKTALRKKGGHIYGKNEGWAYLRKLLYIWNFNSLVVYKNVHDTQACSRSRSWRDEALTDIFEAITLASFGPGLKPKYFLN